ncbi:unnamed protein product, partial [marine sediment metagenome]
MKKNMNRKMKLVLTLAICVLFVAVAYSSAVAKKPPKPKDKPDMDWDYWTNPPQMFAIPDGNVGIGTVSPSEKLEVDGNIAVSGTVDGVDISAHEANPSAHHTKTTDASELTIGTLDDARLSSNVPLKNAANVFTANQDIIGSSIDLRLSSTSGLGPRITMNTLQNVGSGSTIGAIYFKRLGVANAVAVIHADAGSVSNAGELAFRTA